jgi:hypothetical protein
MSLSNEAWKAKVTRNTNTHTRGGRDGREKVVFEGL